MPPVFAVQNLCAAYGSKAVLQGVSFSISQPGQLVGLLGANGSGKTTLLRAVCGSIPHTGQCLLNGLPLESLSTRQLAQQVSYVPQHSGISIAMSALDVVLMGFNPHLRLLEQPNAAQRTAAYEALQQVGLAALAQQDYLTLSGGEQQLCILARTLIERSALLLLDEPDSALDFHNRTQLLRLVAQLVQRDGHTGILCLHDPAPALAFCDILLLLKDGRLAAELHPKTDSLAAMQDALCQIYGPVELLSVQDRAGRSRLVLLPE